MNVDQVKLIRDYCYESDGKEYPDGKERTKAFSCTAVFNNELSFCNVENFLIWDDTNELVHYVSPNSTDVLQQAIAPYKISTGFYGNIQYMEGLYTMNNFADAIKELFLDKGLITENQYTMIVDEWALSIRNSVPDRSAMYFSESPVVPAKPLRFKKRRDGKIRTSAVGISSDKVIMEDYILDYMDSLMDSNNKITENGIKSMYYIFETDDPDEVKSTIKTAVENFASGIDSFKTALVFGQAHSSDPYNTAVYTSSPMDDFDDILDKICSKVAGAPQVIRVIVRAKYYDTTITFNIDKDFYTAWASEADKTYEKFIRSICDSYNHANKIGNKVIRKEVTTEFTNSLRKTLDSIKGANYTLTSAGSSSEYMSGGSDESYEAFALELLNAIPSEDGGMNILQITSERGNTMLTYKFNVLYVAPDQAAVDGIIYHTLVEAIEAANENSLIRVLTDIELKSALEINKTVAIDFTGYKIYGNPINITGGKVTMQGSGTMASNITVASTENLLISGGKYVVFDPTDYVETGMYPYFIKATEEEDAYWTVLPASEAYSYSSDGKRFLNLIDAFDAVPYGGTEPVTITLNKDTIDCGIIVGDPATRQTKNIILDMNGHIFAANKDPMAGSTGTKNQAFQLLKGCTVVMKNGTLKSEQAKMMIQNYCDLTLEDVIIDCSDSEKILYVVSNNCGKLTVKGNTRIIAPEGKVAFDVWYGMSDLYAAGVEVEFTNDFTGYVVGKVEYGADNKRGHDDWTDLCKIGIKAGTFDIEFSNSSPELLPDFNSANIKLSGGSFNAEPNAAFLEEGYIVVENEGRYEVRLQSGEEEKAAERVIDEYIDGLDIEGFDIEETSDNTYSVTTNKQSFSQSGIIDTFLGCEGLESIECTDGDEISVLAKADFDDEAKVAEFVDSVNAMIPEDGETKEIVFNLTF